MSFTVIFLVVVFVIIFIFALAFCYGLRKNARRAPLPRPHDDVDSEIGVRPSFHCPSISTFYSAPPPSTTPRHDRRGTPEHSPSTGVEEEKEEEKIERVETPMKTATVSPLPGTPSSMPPSSSSLCTGVSPIALSDSHLSEFTVDNTVQSTQETAAPTEDPRPFAFPPP